MTFLYKPDCHFRFPKTVTVLPNPLWRSNPIYSENKSALVATNSRTSVFADQMYPGPEWAAHYKEITGQSLTIHFQPKLSSDTMLVASHDNFIDILRLLKSVISNLLPLSNDSFDSLCLTATPHHLATAIVSSILSVDTTHYLISAITTVLCFHGRTSPTTSNWTAAYQAYKETAEIVRALTNEPNHKWNKRDLRKIHFDYCLHLCS
uniref:Uncharacterized protein n=1 Tax=Odontella aurita TaxID=265563 RepID=A0A7S4NEQ5_9STRA|mmetsp:Transcript_60021/g.177959  ORF Transcript_60021/g.177959 Transcript_60021/m.177959 type:complete len:207 (+) Transcript_60021:1677-2297(+)